MGNETEEPPRALAESPKAEPGPSVWGLQTPYPESQLSYPAPFDPPGDGFWDLQKHRLKECR